MSLAVDLVNAPIRVFAAPLFFLLLFVPMGALTKGVHKIGTIFVWWAYPLALFSALSGQWAECLFPLVVIGLHISVALGLAWLIAYVWRKKKL